MTWAGAARWAAAAALGYEAAAVCSGRLPTITALCARRRVLAAGVVAALAAHLWLAAEPGRGTVPARAPAAGTPTPA